MKRLLFVLVIALLVAPALAEYENFQDYPSVYSGPGPRMWFNSFLSFYAPSPGESDNVTITSAVTTLGEVFARTYSDNYDSIHQDIWIGDGHGPMQYAAISRRTSPLVDTLATFCNAAENCAFCTDRVYASSGTVRIEAFFDGSTATVYQNGGLTETCTGLSANQPYYLRVYGSTIQYDDAVWDSGDALDAIAPNTFVGYDVSTNISALYYSNDFGVDATNINGYYMGVGYGLDATGETLRLTDPTGDIVHEYTLENRSAYLSYPLSSLYQGGTIEQGKWQWSIVDSGVVEEFYVMATGAWVAWDDTEYVSGDVATIHTYVSDSKWAEGGSYTLKVMDVYGNVYQTSTVALQDQDTTYQWGIDEDVGAYYAILYRNGDFTAYDTTSLTQYFNIQGYVHSAETEQPIVNASVNCSQSSTRSNSTTNSSGYYTCGGFITGTEVGINTSATDHQEFWCNFTPLYSHTLNINSTLHPGNHTITGTTIGGIARDSTYCRPIPNKQVQIWNSTYGQWFLTNPTNSVGFYNQTYATGSRLYDIQGIGAPGYSNSTVYQLLTGVGS